MRIQMMSLPREAASVPLVRHTVSAALRRAGVTADCVAEVEVAVSEACTNMVRQGRHHEVFEVTMEVSGDQLTVDVVGAGPGTGWIPTQVGSAEPAVNGERRNELIDAFTDSAVIETSAGGGGSAHLVKRLSWVDGAPGRGGRGQRGEATTA